MEIKKCRISKGIAAQASHRSVRAVSRHTALVIQSICHSKLPMVEQCRTCIYKLIILAHYLTNASQLIRISDPLFDQRIQATKYCQHLVPVVPGEVIDPAFDPKALIKMG